MNDLTQLTEAEIAAVAGGYQSISIYASQSNSSSVSQAATASNSYSPVSATAWGPYATAAAAGAEANNTALVYQSNSIHATNVFHY